MKRFTRRTVGAMVGLCLGWVAAGLAFSPGNLSMAADTPAGQHVSDAHDSGQHGHGPKDKGQEAAAKLVPHDAEDHPAQPEWFGTVLKAIAGLFVAAVVIGVPALRARGGDPAGLATAHDQAHAHHDDHEAHDDHSHAHAAAGGPAH